MKQNTNPSLPSQYAQELLSTFGLAIGEVSLQPSTGGTFIITIHHPSNTTTITTWTSVLWDRKVDGGFPETKELKRRVRDVIEPGRNLGHVDREHARPPQPPQKKDEVKAEDGGGSMDWQQQNANRGGMAVGKNEDGGETAIASSEGVQEGKPTCEDCR